MSADCSLHRPISTESCPGGPAPPRKFLTPPFPFQKESQPLPYKEAQRLVTGSRMRRESAIKEPDPIPWPSLTNAASADVTAAAGRTCRANLTSGSASALRIHPSTLPRSRHSSNRPAAHPPGSKCPVVATSAKLHQRPRVHGMGCAAWRIDPASCSERNLPPAQTGLARDKARQDQAGARTQQSKRISGARCSANGRARLQDPGRAFHGALTSVGRRWRRSPGRLEAVWAACTYLPPAAFSQSLPMPLPMNLRSVSTPALDPPGPGSGRPPDQLFFEVPLASPAFPGGRLAPGIARGALLPRPSVNPATTPPWPICSTAG